MTDYTELKIHSSRLVLTPFHALDAKACFHCITPTLTRFMTWEPPESLAVFEDIWRSWQTARIEQRELVFSIKQLDSNAFVGLVAIHHLKSNTPELGIWIREDIHGQGYGAEAVSTLKDWASLHFEPEYFIYPVASENLPSRRIAESLGGVVHTQIQKNKYMAVVYHIPLSSAP